jgi:cyclomaltodextrinase
MRIILDGVFNHASRSFFQFSHVVENGPLSPYVDWFFVERFPLRPYHAPRGQHGYAAWWGLPALPKLKVTTPAVREFLWNVATHWLDFGIDGWRLDVPEEIDDDEFWREFRRCVKDANPEAYVVGEIWHKAARWLQGDQFDAVMNYLFTRACLGFFVGDNLLRSEVAQTGYQTIDTLTAEEFQDEIKALLGMYDRSITEVQFNLLGSHDTPRFRTLARGDDTAYRLATLFQMTYPGAPCVYYGDEIGMEGTHDPGCRGAFPWDETQWDQELRTFVRRCISLRRAHPALRRGEFNWLFAGQGVVAYLRKLGNEAVIVVLNNSHRPVTLDMPVGEHLPDGLCFQHAWQGGTATTRNGHLPGVPVAARSGVVLVANAAADQV